MLHFSQILQHQYIKIFQGQSSSLGNQKDNLIWFGDLILTLYFPFFVREHKSSKRVFIYKYRNDNYAFG